MYGAQHIATGDRCDGPRTTRSNGSGAGRPRTGEKRRDTPIPSPSLLRSLSCILPPVSFILLSLLLTSCPLSPQLRLLILVRLEHQQLSAFPARILSSVAAAIAISLVCESTATRIHSDTKQSHSYSHSPRTHILRYRRLNRMLRGSLPSSQTLSPPPSPLRLLFAYNLSPSPPSLFSALITPRSDAYSVLLPCMPALLSTHIPP
jgi:hypothetical protein